LQNLHVIIETYITHELKVEQIDHECMTREFSLYLLNLNSN